MKILLTGASGLLGSHLLKQGLERDYTFKALSRGPAKRSYLAEIKGHPKVEIINSDLSAVDVASLEGIDCILNCAALVSSRGQDQALMTEVNLEAPKRLYQNAVKAGVKSWVQISSISTMSDGESEQLIDETYQGRHRNTHYARTKYQIDQWLEKQTGLQTCSIHPCYLLGAHDSRPSSGAVLLALKFKKIKMLLNRTKNFISAQDVATGIYQAMDKKAQGHYILGGENIPISDFIKLCEQKLKIISDIKFIDDLDDLVDLNQEEVEFVKEFSLTQPVSVQKAKRELNFKATLTTSEALDQLIQYFVEHKLLRIK